MSCICSKFNNEDGRFECSVSGDECIFLIPDSKKCADEYGEGPDMEE